MSSFDINRATENTEEIEALYLAYLYMINHIGNPIIYYAVNKRFREDANALGRKFIAKFRNST